MGIAGHPPARQNGKRPCSSGACARGGFQHEKGAAIPHDKPVAFSVERPASAGGIVIASRSGPEVSKNGKCERRGVHSCCSGKNSICSTPFEHGCRQSQGVIATGTRTRQLNGGGHGA